MSDRCILYVWKFYLSALAVLEQLKKIHGEHTAELFLRKALPRNMLCWELFLSLAGRAETGWHCDILIRCCRNLLSLSFVMDICDFWMFLEVVWYWRFFRLPFESFEIYIISFIAFRVKSPPPPCFIGTKKPCASRVNAPSCEKFIIVPNYIASAIRKFVLDNHMPSPGSLQNIRQQDSEHAKQCSSKWVKA